MIIFKDFYVRLFKSYGKNGVSLCNLSLPLWLESSLSSVFLHRGVYLCVCVRACMFTTPVTGPAVCVCVRQLHSEHQYVCVCVHIGVGV